MNFGISSVRFQAFVWNAFDEHLFVLRQAANGLSNTIRRIWTLHRHDEDEQEGRPSYQIADLSTSSVYTRFMSSAVSQRDSTDDKGDSTLYVLCLHRNSEGLGQIPHKVNPRVSCERGFKSNLHPDCV